VRHPGETECAQRAAALAEALRAFSGVVEVRGPSICPIARVAGKYRRQIELTAESAAEISRVLAEARSRGLLKLGEELAVDVDALSAI
jgi:primosomal protein N'